jgi:quinol monooxygenase YgiN
MTSLIIKVKALHYKYEELKQALIGIDIKTKPKAGLKFLIEEQDGCMGCNIRELDKDIFIIDSEWKNKEMLEIFFRNRYFKILTGALKTLGESTKITITENGKGMKENYIQKFCAELL